MRLAAMQVMQADQKPLNQLVLAQVFIVSQVAPGPDVP